ncbi:MAG: SUMF1/EgtB/PvdO family nonheme iron enzyme, partial [Candidatus Aminicenantes bacterium]|nr:SUMF1/EgtB/PvdO family nonheme iron enzyme [Candidatus Aminicenantes bacterium]
LKSSLYIDIRHCYERLQVKLGDYYFERGKPEEALACYYEANKYSEQGYKDKILKCKALISAKSMIKDLLEVGIYHYDNNDYDKAEEEFKKILSLDPNDSTAREYIGKIAEQKLTFRQYLQLKNDPNYPLDIAELKTKLYKKFPHLPPEDFLQYLQETKNKQGYWQAEFNGHLMVYIPQTENGKGGFFVDIYEVSIGRFETAKEITQNKVKPVDKPKLFARLTAADPAVVSFEEAETYCRKKGFRLLTEDEWEFIAGKDKSYTYPWGNEEVDSSGVYRANYDDSMNYWDGYAAVAPVKSYENYASPYGIVNLAGNVWEWIQGKKCKGGGFLSEKEDLKLTSSSSDEIWVGFRCVKEVQK